MLLAIALDTFNLLLVIYIIIKLIKNYNEYKTDYRFMRLAIICGLCIFLFIIIILLINSIEYILGVQPLDYTIPVTFSRILLRIGIFSGQIIFVGIIKGVNLDFISIDYWKKIFKKGNK